MTDIKRQLEEWAKQTDVFGFFDPQVTDLITLVESHVALCEKQWRDGARKELCMSECYTVHDLSKRTLEDLVKHQPMIKFLGPEKIWVIIEKRMVSLQEILIKQL